MEDEPVPESAPAAAAPHVPVLPAEILALLDPQPGETFVDATVGLGGHSVLIAERLGPAGRLIGIDQDPASLAFAQTRQFPCPVMWLHGNFQDLGWLLRDAGVFRVDGVLADLGVSSPQLDRPERGFSFLRDGPLDMRMDPTGGETAANLVARLTERDLANLIWEHGEERHSRRIAAKLVAERRRAPIATTGQLAALVRSVVPSPPPWKGGIDGATRTFQALRIAVNGELDALDALLEALPKTLAPGGRAGIVSFHSLEDRRVKRAFQDRERWDVRTKKPVQAGENERYANPRSRSAKLRVAALRAGTD